MEQGFKDRARKVHALLRKDDTAFVLIASPNADTVAEAGYFASELKRLEIEVRALVVNRMSPVFGDEPARSEGVPASDPVAGIEAPDGSALADLLDCLAQARASAAGEQFHLRGIAADVAPAPVVGVAIQPFEVSDIESLTKLASVLFDPDSTLTGLG
jgi:anion-transporting  ArsA/GET3 family ATPase